MIKNYFKKTLKFLYFIFKILRLKNKDFTIIASNCIGGLLYNDLRMRYLTPFVGLYMEASGFIKLLYNFDYYMTLPIAPEAKERQLSNWVAWRLKNSFCSL